MLVILCLLYSLSPYIASSPCYSIPLLFYGIYFISLDRLTLTNLFFIPVLPSYPPIPSLSFHSPLLLFSSSSSYSSSYSSSSLSIFCKLAALVRHRVSLFGKDPEPAWWTDACWSPRNLISLTISLHQYPSLLPSLYINLISLHQSHLSLSLYINIHLSLSLSLSLSVCLFLSLSFFLTLSQFLSLNPSIAISLNQ